MDDKHQIDYCRCEVHPNIGGKCLATIWNEKVVEFSRRKWGKSICYRCQEHQPENKVPRDIENDSPHLNDLT